MRSARAIESRTSAEGCRSRPCSRRCRYSLLIPAPPADAGFAVTRFDNRDTGLSTRFSTAGVPSLFMMLTRPAAAVIYRLEDMADDAISVLDALGSDGAHIVGVSLGGMIAQTIAIRSPARVDTLTCISSTPYWRIGRKKLSTSIRTSLAGKSR